jgi:hypothetical protein
MIASLLLISAGLALMGESADGKMSSKNIWLESRIDDMPQLPMGPFVRLANGHVLAIDTPNAILESGDEGKTWQSRPLFAEADKYDVRQERSLIRTKNGTVILAFMNGKERANWKWDPKTSDSPDAQLPTYVVRSLDDGQTWQSPQKLHDDWTGDLRDMIQTREGNVVLSSMMMLHNPGRHAVVSYSSADDGQTWRRSNLIDLGGAGHHDGAMEATIEQLRDGRIWMLIRTNLKVFWEALSLDQGVSWRTIRPTSIDASSSPGMLKRLASGRLVLFRNRNLPADGKYTLRGGDRQLSEVPTSFYRLELTLQLSDDDGQTWTDPVVIARIAKGSLAYPRVFEARPGQLWLTTMQGGLRCRFAEAAFVKK